MLCCAVECVVFGVGRVDCMFFLFWSRCPIAVASDLGRCFRMLDVVSMGQVAKLPWAIAFSSVDVDGLKRAL